VNLTRSFTLEELKKSQTALNRGLNNEPGPGVIENLRALCENVLQPVRDHFDFPVSIVSGYRSANVNRAVGGTYNSQHMIGQAADIEIYGVHNADVWRFILTLDFDQVIAEHLKKDNPNAGWIHVSYAGSKNRKEALSCVSAGTYERGLHYAL
jgi:zinc D-Ala-D-Ala carboxypeptidase